MLFDDPEELGRFVEQLQHVMKPVFDNQARQTDSANICRLAAALISKSPLPPETAIEQAFELYESILVAMEVGKEK